MPKLQGSGPGEDGHKDMTLLQQMEGIYAAIPVWPRETSAHVQELYQEWLVATPPGPSFSPLNLRACLEVLAGERSYSYTLDRRPVLSSGGKVVLFDQARSFGRDAHGSVREEGDTRLASQISRINTGDQWGDRCRSQIALTSSP
ncbi:Nuclear prelamin A recognition factor [Myotis davidii]|uniref:Nuclear prelamin A recognition factor n=1 Tax=Myotis davidii TaxID=225400 RepID=L5MJT6_MYODS|nr:Nuclear prelamin A recognition factor [Myotis davidii]